ncbi:MAG: hypothetical protein Q9227_006126 [Pyrenula ochraceoflavens]
MASDLENDDFEIVDSNEVAKDIVAQTEPDVAKIQSWLKPTEYAASSSEYHRHLSSQSPGTGEWIRSTSHFRQWHESAEHGSLWIKAVPGAGKSVVAAAMTHSLMRNEDVPVLYFFFRQIIEANRDARSLLRDWISQLLPFSAILQVALWDLVEQDVDLATVSSDQLWKFVLSGLRSVEKAYCVVDALNEMTVDQDFLTQINTLGSFRPASVKIILTSRPKQYLQQALRDPQVIHVSLEQELVKRDIAVFVNQRVADFAQGGVSEKNKEYIKTTICDRSQGLFLYARLMLDQIEQSIQDQCDEISISESVSKLPVGLEDMYSSVLDEHATRSNIPQQIQLLILQLVTHSGRPLRLIELAKFLETDSLIPKIRKDTKDIARTACGPLLEIMEDETVQILHHSLTEFLLDTSRVRRNPENKPQFPVIDPAIAHYRIAIACFTRLRLDSSDLESRAEIPTLAEHSDIFYYAGRVVAQGPSHQTLCIRYPGLAYTASFWYHHCKYCSSGLMDYLDQFCDPATPQFRTWLAFMSAETDQRVPLIQVSALHIAAGLGLPDWAEYLVRKGVDIDARDGTENSPLFWAAKGGHTEVVDLLLKAGAKGDIDGRDGLMPLHISALRNHAQVTKLLLAAGVAPTIGKPREIGRFCGNASSSVGDSPLKYASQWGHVESVLEMIPYAQTSDLDQALCWAARSGHVKLIKALLDHSSASPDAVDYIRYEGVDNRIGGETVLMLAVHSLEPEAVRVLLDNGASATKASSRDVNSRYPMGATHKIIPEGRTSLHSLAMTNIDLTVPTKKQAAAQILSMLVSSGANLEARDAYGNTPILLTTSHHGFGLNFDPQNCIELLLRAGADPCAANDNGETLLHKACEFSQTIGIARILLHHNANPVQARAIDGSTPLHCAVKNRRSAEEHLKLLAAHGADINTEDAAGNSPLHMACKGPTYERLESAINALLDLHAAVRAQNYLGETCLHLFRPTPHNHEKDQEIVNALIDAGADLELRDREGRTVLLYAVEKNTEILDLLFQLPIKPSLTARTFRYGKTALHLACRQSDQPQNLLEKLISYGADLTVTDNDGNTLLHETASRFEGRVNEVALVERLLDLGVSVDEKNCRRQTALHVCLSLVKISTRSDLPFTRETFASVIMTKHPTTGLNDPDIDGYTPLHCAAAKSELQCFKLICAGANVNARSFNNRTPLHCAASGRQSSIIAMLIHFGKEHESGIDINAADDNGRTPLFDACRSGIPESVRILIDAGANVDCHDKNSFKPLTACIEFIEDFSLRFCVKNSPTIGSLHFQNDFRAMRSGLQPSSVENKIPRISVIVKMLLAAGAIPERLPYSAALSESANIMASIRDNSRDRQSAAEPTYLDTLVMFSNRLTYAALGQQNWFNPLRRPEDLDILLDEATVDAMISRDADLIHVSKRGDLEIDTAIYNIVTHGLVELIPEIAARIKLLDEPPICTNVEKYHRPDERRRPSLQAACDRSTWNLDMIRLLILKVQVDVNAHTYMRNYQRHKVPAQIVPGPTALHVLAQGKFWWQIEGINFLIENGAEVDAQNEKGQTPLHIASTHQNYYSNGHQGLFKPQCCEVLLLKGADPNKIDNEGQTPLILAGLDSDIITVLLRHGADVNAGSKSVLTSAIEAGNIDTLRLYLRSGVDCNCASTSTLPTFGNKPAIREYPLLVAASSPSSSKKRDTTAASEMIRMLLQHGAKADVFINEDETLLHHLFRNSPSSVLRPFLEEPNLDFNIRDKKGRTVFMSACKSMVKAEPGYEYLPLRDQRRYETEYVPSYMLLADAAKHNSFVDFIALDDEGRSIINYLLPHWSDDVASRFLAITGVQELITRKDSSGFSPLHHALRNRNVQACDTFIRKGSADLLEPDANGDTALHYLIRGGSPYSKDVFRLIEAYLNLGGHIDARNHKGDTALLAYIKSSPKLAGWWYDGSSRIDIIEFFAERSADITAANEAGETALHLIAKKNPSKLFRRERKGTEDHYAKVFKRCVDLGGDPLREDANGRTALDMAAAVGNNGILALYQRRKEGRPKQERQEVSDFSDVDTSGYDSDS